MGQGGVGEEKIKKMTIAPPGRQRANKSSSFSIWICTYDCSSSLILCLLLIIFDFV